MTESNSARPGHRSLRLLFGFALLAVLGATIALEVRSLSASSSPTLAVNPQSQSELWYRPTPITFTIQGSSLSGSGLGDASGYQYALQWNPAVLKWLSGPQVGPGTPTPAPVLPCSNNPYMITWGSPTATPTNLVPTFTPTYTNTPAPGTPSNTPTITNTPTQTPTPGGYVLVGCANISGTAVPSGNLGTWTFQPLVTGQALSTMNLLSVQLVDHDGTAIPATAVSGIALFPDCHDVTGDGKVNILDLSSVASHYQTSAPAPPAPTPTPGGPYGTYDPRYDVNLDGHINVLDLSLVAGAFQMTC